jgi:hypothetical protein
MHSGDIFTGTKSEGFRYGVLQGCDRGVRERGIQERIYIKK